MKKGSTRTVYFIGNYVIKIPRTITFKLFLCGLLANMQETLFYNELKHDKLCPVLFSILGGFLLVMPKSIRLSNTC